MVCLWVHFDGLDWKSNILVDLTTTKFLPDDQISQRITETETEDELLAVIDGLYESDKPQRKRKQKTETTGTEESVDNNATKKKGRKGIDKAVIRQLKRAAPVKEVDDANMPLAKEAGQWTDTQIFAFDQCDKNFRDKDIEMANTDALEEKRSAENNPSISNDVEAVNEHAYNENATDHTPEEESLFIKSDSDSANMQNIPLRSKNTSTDGTESGKQPTPIAHVIGLVENSTVESFDTIKDEVLKYFKAVQQASTAKAAQIQSQLGEGPENRIQALKTYVPSSFAHISERLWGRYSRKLSRFCEEPGFLELDYMQRLEGVMDIFYLPEEAMAFGDCDWRRMELAVSICVAITEMMGDDTDSEKDEGKEWAKGKLEDIRWLKKISKVLPTEKTVIEIDD